MTARESPTDAKPGVETRLVGSERVLAVLTELAAHPQGIALEDMAAAMKSPKPTVHRALASLRRAGLADKDARGHYVLGDGFLRMAFAHHEERPDHVRIAPVLERLAVEFGEAAHYTILDGKSVVYRSKVDPAVGAIKLTSMVGGRNPAHATAVGKLLLSYTLRSRSDVETWAASAPLIPRTERTITTTEGLWDELERVRVQGYAIDDHENEDGVNCIAVPAFLTSPRSPSGAVSVSALAFRTPVAALVAGLPRIRAAVAAAGFQGVV